MDYSDSFPDRFKLRQAQPVTIREDAPGNVRHGIYSLVSAAGLKPFQLRRILCRRLLVKENTQLVEDHRILAEVELLLADCHWYHVYGFVEDVYAELAVRPTPSAEEYAMRVNTYFAETGIGWELQNGRLQPRGGAGLDHALQSALAALERSGRQTAHEQLREAMQDLSRVPEAEVTGAVQHAIGALECVARDLVGDPQMTLGKLVKHYPDLMPTTLASVVDKAYGFASNEARHLVEGRKIDFCEAELTVSLSAAVITYLLRLEHRAGKS
jgi:hypothetical protein